jgi:cytochrome c oxidase assembly protein subunit 11
MLKRLDRNMRVLLGCLATVAGMLALTYASVPLYRLFCQVTGYGGTTQVAEGPSSRVLDRVITVRFDANVGAGLDWSFQPLQREIKVRIGETGLAQYRTTNLSGRDVVGRALYNVTPDKVGQLFDKIECFCFQEQTLKAGETVDMPVAFYIDPKIADDPDLDDVSEVTLSYTFFPAETAIPDASEARARLRSMRSLRPGTEARFASGAN